MNNIKPLPTIFTSIDLEMAQPSGNIISVGYCIGNIYTGEILHKNNILVYQEDIITEYITKLTRITQEDVNSGIALCEAYNKLAEDHKAYNSFWNNLQWGQGDAQELKNQLKAKYSNIYDYDNNWVFGRGSFDVKKLFQVRCLIKKEKLQSGLAKALTRVGKRFQGTKHNSMDDAVNTFYIFVELLKQFENGVSNEL